MSKTASAFDHGKAMIPFLTCGDPSLSATAEFLAAEAEAGADLLELGLPFSDPMAEGPVIMEASFRALSAGATTDKIFDMVAEVRKTVKIPMVFMTYANLLFSYGFEEFTKAAKELEIDGFILPDIPFEEKNEFVGITRKYGLDLISMIAPTSKERIEMIASEADGFLYCVSSLGVTGTRSEITTDVGDMVRTAKGAKDIPCAIGFGISTPEQAAKMAAQADGVIVGSALVSLAAQYGSKAADHIYKMVKNMKTAISEGGLS